MKNNKKAKRITGGLILIICFTYYLSFPVIYPKSKEVIIDSLYVDYNNDLTAHIRNYRDTEECVRKVFHFYEESDYEAICFVSSKGATRIEHKYMYVDDLRTNRFTFLKCDSIPLSLGLFHIGLKRKPRPISFEMTRREDSTYFKGDFEEMNFSILKSFKREVIFGKFEKKEYHTYVLVNKYGVYKFELSSYNPGMGDCRTYKIY